MAEDLLGSPGHISALHRLAKEGDSAGLAGLLSEENRNVNIRDQFGSTPLHLAAHHGKLDCVKVLLAQQEVDINCKDVFGRTPIFFAARNGHHSILVELLSRGADVSLRAENSGETPLMKAAHYGHLDCLMSIVETLNKRKESKWINEGDSAHGNTALHMAVTRGFDECVSFLIQSGASVDALNNSGCSPLHLAVQYKQLKCASVLLQAGADIEIRNNNARSVLQECKAVGAKDIASMIKKKRYDDQMRLLKRKPIVAWTADDVGRFIALAGFPQYRDAFTYNDINGKSLANLTLTTLKNDLNIASFGHRSAILEQIKQLSKETDNTDNGHQAEAKVSPVMPLSPTKQQLPQDPAPNEQQDMANTRDALDFEAPAVQQIAYTELQMGDLLGKGFFGEVRKALWKGTPVAVKIIYRGAFGSSKDLSIFYKELNIISKLRHPNVLLFLGACLQAENRCIVTEFLAGGNVYNLIHYNWDTLEKSAFLRFRIACDVIKGMTYLHDLNIHHRDLTPKNLLLDVNLNCKVCDFGLSRIREDSGEMTTSMGCLPYQAPEVFRGERYTAAADVYSFGVVVFELVSGSDPHKGLQPLKFANMVAYENYRPNLPPCAPNWENIIVRCWRSAPTERPSFKELLAEVLKISKFDALKLKTPTAEDEADGYIGD